MDQEVFGKNRILVVDDDRYILELIPAMLQSDLPGAVFMGARDGEEALLVFEQSKPKPGIIILDMMLPKRSGFLVYDRIRQFHKPPFPLVIMITGNMANRHREYARQVGINEYLTKPFRKEQLLAAVQRLRTKIETVEPKLY